MKRKIETALRSWKEKTAGRKPLLISGARQVGKTYTIRQFGKHAYENTVYVNLENNPDIAALFDGEIEPSRLIKYLEAVMQCRILPNQTLLFFDEIQNCPRAVTALKYFCEDAPQYHVIAAGSLLGVAINREEFSFPVGKVETLQMYPLDFEEFLYAAGETALISMISEAFTLMQPLPELFHRKALERYLDYLIVGGMPAVVQAFIEENSYISASILQKEILHNYTADMAKYASASETVKIRACYSSIPAQLAKENKKFQYKVVQRGGNASLFGPSLDWLKQAGTILKCRRITEGKEPIAAYEDLSAFKIYMSDVGLLVSASGMSYQTILSGMPNSFMGAVTENYVAQQLASKDYPLFYWTKEGSQAELDFVLQKGNEIYAIEVKKGEKVKSRSLGIFSKSYTPAKVIRLSSKNFGQSGDISAIPLYAVFCL
ncbi:ATP-binding protein [Ihubacter sp. mB4P-1]|uniref:ATP-binding protein n=1 Tax=Ihubacter sp. mB4P-1 TaxID=3242370 RepID=UPI003C7E5555